MENRGRENKKSGIQLIEEERRRQIEELGWTPEKDSQVHTSQQLIDVALAYLRPHDFSCPTGWPWGLKWWHPSPEDRVRELTKAGALIAAEIDRILFCDDYSPNQGKRS